MPRTKKNFAEETKKITSTDLEKWYKHTKLNRDGSINLIKTIDLKNQITQIGYIENDKFIPIDEILCHKSNMTNDIFNQLNKKEKMTTNDQSTLYVWLGLSDDITNEELLKHPLTEEVKKILDKKGITIEEILGINKISIGVSKNMVRENLENKYDHIGSSFEGFLTVSKDGKWGLIDTAKKEIVAPKYDYIDNLCNGFAKVNIGGKWGFIDTTGKEIVAPRYDLVENFDNKKNGFATVFTSLKLYKDDNIVEYGRWGFIDTTGQEYDLDYHEGLAAVNTERGWGFVNIKGEVVIPFMYHYVGDFINGKAEVILRGETFYIDKQGNRINTNTNKQISRINKLIDMIDADKQVNVIKKGRPKVTNADKQVNVIKKGRPKVKANVDNKQVNVIKKGRPKLIKN